MRVLTLGSFDMMHPGHLGLFRWCRAIAGPDGHVTVGVNSSEFITRFKTSPRYKTDERVEMVSALKDVDAVVVNSGLDQPGLIESVNPQIMVIGSDWWRKDILAQNQISVEWLEEHGIGFAYVPRTGDWSSTELRSRGIPAGAFTGGHS